mmetsp:Transcript_16902/g.25571  ORF Transcript_16902/g.25571 Transcript_16902/m.25571 type:complete len:291 (-) Transcript_16902:432-1304(-)
MPKFSDQWVIDRTLFEYVNGGSCACCGGALFMPGGLDGMIKSVSDLETDAANAEIKAMAKSPWPPEMREEVWSDRVRIRVKMKKEMGRYKEFWAEHGEDFTQWCKTGIEPKKLRKIMQMSRSEIQERLRSVYGIHSAFGRVLEAVTEQVARFKDTKYPTDARGDSEIRFEQILTFDRRGGFVLRIKDKEGNLKEDVLEIWLGRMRSLGGPSLLERAPRKEKSDEDDDEAGGADEAEMGETASFRADRRIIRLFIARFWADTLIERFKASISQIGEVEEKVEEKLTRSDDT